MFINENFNVECQIVITLAPLTAAVSSVKNVNKWHNVHGVLGLSQISVYHNCK